VQPKDKGIKELAVRASLGKLFQTDTEEGMKMSYMQWCVQKAGEGMVHV